jgi:hypothetical protein
MTPMITWDNPIPIDPAIIRGLRPTLSMNKIAGMVVATLITPMTPVARREIVLLVRPRDWKMLGA